MAYSRTLAVLRGRAAYLADIQIAVTGTAADRHELTDVNTEVNASYRKFLTMLKTKGFDFNLQETAQANLPTSRADTNEAYSQVVWPDSSYLKRIDVLVGGQWTELSPRDWGQLRSEYRSGTGTFPRPLVWAPKSEGSINVDGVTPVAGVLAIAPFCPTGKYKITFQPRHTEVTTDGFIFLFPDENCSEWVCWDVACKFAARDRDNKKQYEICDKERTNCAIAIGEFVPEIVDTGPLTMTRGPNYFT